MSVLKEPVFLKPTGEETRPLLSPLEGLEDVELLKTRMVQMRKWMRVMQTSMEPKPVNKTNLLKTKTTPRGLCLALSKSIFKFRTSQTPLTMNVTPPCAQGINLSFESCTKREKPTGDTDTPTPPLSRNCAEVLSF